MALTDLMKAREAVWVDCPIPGFDDERHLILPSTRGVLTDVRDKSQVREWERGQIVHKSDPNLFDQEYINTIWVGWENAGIIHEDGRVENPAAVTPANKAKLIHSRPIEFQLWLQRTSDELAAQSAKQTEQQRESFRGAGEAPPQLPTAEL